VAPLLLHQSRATEALDVSESTLTRLVRSGQLPVVRLGRATLVRVVDLERFVVRLGK
jgi:excisionase family DNA binding protein